MKRHKEVKDSIPTGKGEKPLFTKHEKDFLSIWRCMGDFAFYLDGEGIFRDLYHVPGHHNKLGWPEDLIGYHFRECLTTSLAEVLQQALGHSRLTGQVQRFDFHVGLRRCTRWMGASVAPCPIISGRTNGFILAIREITERKQREEKFLQDAEKYRAVMQQNTECIILADIETRVIVEANQAMQRLLGYNLEEIPGLSLYDLVEPEEEDIYHEILKVLEERYYFIGERRFRRKDGRAIDVEICANLIAYGNKKVLCVSARDISPRKLAEKQLAYTATHDPLTGLINRLLFYDKIAQELALARRRSQKLALLFIDLDRFKQINDTLGHGIGDQMLKSAGDRIKDLFPCGKTLARMGGDEYMCIFPDVGDTREALQKAEKILQEIRKPFDVDGHKLFISASIGISLYPDDGTNYDVLIKAADRALYYAKDRGRNNCQLYGPELL